MSLLQPLNGSNSAYCAVHQAMDQIYMTNVLWLSSLWKRTDELTAPCVLAQTAHVVGGLEQAMMGVMLLDCLAYLQPARMRLSMATNAVHAALSHVASSSQVAISLPDSHDLSVHLVGSLLQSSSMSCSGRLRVPRFAYLMITDALDTTCQPFQLSLLF